MLTFLFIFRVQNWAKKAAGVNLKVIATKDGKATGEVPKKSKRPYQVNSYQEYFKVYRIDMVGEPFGKGMQEDLAKVQNTTISHLMRIEEEVFHNENYMLSLHYVCTVVRGAEFVNNEMVAGNDTDTLIVRSDARTKMETVVPLKKDDVGRAVGACYNNIMNNFYSYNIEGSNWVWLKSNFLLINVAKLVYKLPETSTNAAIMKELGVTPPPEDTGKGKEKVDLPSPELLKDVDQFSGTFLPVPNWIKKDKKNKKAMTEGLFNPKGRYSTVDNQCLQWCILRHFYPYGHPQYPIDAEKYKREGRYRSNVSDLVDALEAKVIAPIKLPEGVTYPILLKDEVFQAIEALNGITLSIFIIGERERQISPYYVSKNKNEQTTPHVRLGLIYGFPKWSKKRKSDEPEETLDVALKRGDPIVHHFVLIKDLSKILGELKVKKKVKSGPEEDGRHISNVYQDDKLCHKTYYCDNCLCRFSSAYGDRGLLEHEKRCLQGKPVPLLLPNLQQRWVEFKKYRHLIPQFCVIYADTEAINQPSKEFNPYQLISAQLQPMEPEDKRDYQEFSPEPLKEPGVVFDHVACAWAYTIVFRHEYSITYHDVLGYQDKPLREPRSYCGPDAMEKFLDSLLYDARVIKGLYQKAHDWEKKKLREFTTEELIEEKKRCTNCYLCKMPMPNAVKTTYFDCYTDQYKGMAHAFCVESVRKGGMYTVPVVMHNFRGYDAYHILHATAQYPAKIKTEVIAKSMESFITMKINGLVRFIDSYQFNKGRLDELVVNLYNTLEENIEGKLTFPSILAKFFNTISWFLKLIGCDGPAMGHMPKFPDNIFAMFKDVCKKGVYPYELPQTIKDLFDCTTYPNRESFNSILKGKGISVADHMRGQRMWDYFKCRNLADYTLRYCELDVMLLADVMESFRSVCLGEGCYGLDPLHYLTAPGLAYQSLLLKNLHNGVRVENISDGTVGIEGLRMAEEGIRGGMCQVQDPYAKAVQVEYKGALNLPEWIGSQWNDDFNGLRDHLKPGQERKIIYLDANNLYGYSMEHKMPVGNFVFLKPGTKEDLSHAELMRLESIEEESDMFSFGDLIRKDMSQRAIWYSDRMDLITQHLLNLNLDGECGYLLEVDLEYPKDVREKHNDLPFCPENKLPPDPSEWTARKFTKLGIKNAFKTKKLIADLNDKKVRVRGLISRCCDFSRETRLGGSPGLGDVPFAGSITPLSGGARSKSMHRSANPYSFIELRDTLRDAATCLETWTRAEEGAPCTEIRSVLLAPGFHQLQYSNAGHVAERHREELLEAHEQCRVRENDGGRQTETRHQAVLQGRQVPSREDYVGSAGQVVQDYRTRPAVPDRDGETGPDSHGQVHHRGTGDPGHQQVHHVPIPLRGHGPFLQQRGSPGEDQAALHGHRLPDLHNPRTGRYVHMGGILCDAESAQLFRPFGYSGGRPSPVHDREGMSVRGEAFEEREQEEAGQVQGCGQRYRHTGGGIPETQDVLLLSGQADDATAPQQEEDEDGEIRAQRILLQAEGNTGQGGIHAQGLCGHILWREGTGERPVHILSAHEDPRCEDRGDAEEGNRASRRQKFLVQREQLRSIWASVHRRMEVPFHPSIGIIFPGHAHGGTLRREEFYRHSFQLLGHTVVRDDGLRHLQRRWLVG